MTVSLWVRWRRPRGRWSRAHRAPGYQPGAPRPVLMGCGLTDPDDFEVVIEIALAGIQPTCRRHGCNPEEAR